MKGNSSSIVQGLSAAAELVDNAVFCGGNLHFRVDAQQLSEFARKLVVNVVSCYKIKPRSQRNEIGPVADRAAFRLCIDFADCEKTAQWSVAAFCSVTISEWYYIKSNGDRRQQTLEQRIDSHSVSTDNRLRADADASTVVKSVGAASVAATVSPPRSTSTSTSTSTPRGSATTAAVDMDHSTDTTLTYDHVELIIIIIINEFHRDASLAKTSGPLTNSFRQARRSNKRRY